MRGRPWAAVIGDPVAHSLSPRIFAAFSSGLGRPLRYRAVRVPAGRLESALSEAGRNRWVGWNVTLPLKVAIVPLLGALDPSARRAGAVNVVRFGPGRLTGYNTDAEGFLAPLRRLGFGLPGKRAVVLGAGGAARAVCSALTEGGARVTALNRTEDRALALAREFGCSGGGLERAAAEVASADLVVNATSAGMDGGASPLPGEARLRRGALAYDLVYRPARTDFLERAASQGARALGGLGMLVAQAAASWRIWFGEEVPAGLAAAVEGDLERSLK